MNSKSISAAWVAKLRQQFYTLYSEADGIIPQEQIQNVRDKFLTAGESIKRFCSELVEDALPILPWEEKGPVSPKQEENTVLPSHEISNISIDDDQEGTSSPLLPTIPDFSGMEKINNGSFTMAKSALEVEESKLAGDGVTSSASSCSTEATHSCDCIRSECESPNEPSKVETITVSDPVSVSALWECMSEEEAPESYVADLGKEATQPSGFQKLDESLVLVGSDECCSESVRKAFGFQKLDESLVLVGSDECCYESVRKAYLLHYQEILKEVGEEDSTDSDWEII